MERRKQTNLILGAILVVFGAGSTMVQGAGFQISEQSVAGMGQAFAGAGILRDDASNMFYNPAGLLANPRSQLQLGASFITADSDFKNEGSTQSLMGRTVPSSGMNTNGGEDAAVPNFYYTSEGEEFKWGIGISAPFGLSTDYEDGWVGRYHALHSEVKTINVNPTVAVKLTDSVSIGGGVSIQKIEATLSHAAFLGPGAPDGKATLKGDDTEFGYNLGLMFEPSDTTRLGLGYRSRNKHRLKGNLKFSGVPGVPASLPSEAEIILPETVFASIAHRFSDATEILGSVRWTKWSRFQELRVQTPGLPDSVTDESWEDVTMLSIGVNHRLNDKWLLRAGYAHDESPISDDAHRTPRIPDADRDWFTLGASMNVNDKVRVDFSYAHLAADDVSMVNTVNLVSSAPGAFTDTLRGSFDSSVNIIGIQVYGEL